MKIFNEQKVNIHQLLDTFLPTSDRWVDAMTLPLVLKLAPIRSRLSSLVKLEVAGALPAEVEDESFWEIFSVAPRLVDLQVDITESHPSVSSIPFVFPWYQLTRLSLDVPSIMDAFLVLPKLTNIVNCQLSYDWEVSFPEATPIRLPHLHSLELIFDRLDYDEPTMPAHMSSSLLNQLDTPKLEVLSTLYAARGSDILSLITRSRCCLTSLACFADDIDHSAVLAAIDLLPRAGNLQIGDFTGSEEPICSFLSQLASRWKSSESTPRLDVRLIDKSDRTFVLEFIMEKLNRLREDSIFVQMETFWQTTPW
ncbi:hypothetical protein C8J57DRAFT_1703518 [Mycena rebaudengoi]|nr:hypothetical protein C8J57DRAFT_1703518 [Mycena rebaudengoi]